MMPSTHVVARSARGPTQRVTTADLRAGRIRLPARTKSDAKSVLPDDSGAVRVILRGEDMAVPYNPRVDADRERSGVLSVGATRLARLVIGVSVERSTLALETIAEVAPIRAPIEEAEPPAWKECAAAVLAALQAIHGTPRRELAIRALLGLADRGAIDRALVPQE